MRKRESQRVDRLKSPANEQRVPEESADSLAVWLQRSVSNSAVARLLARDEAPTKEKPKATALDAKAQAIVDAAQDSKQNIATRAVQSVKSIISTYYSADADLVKEVAYVKSEPGLNTEVATGKNVKGKIEVGDYFVNNTTKKGLARRVIQVDHELEHVRQHRHGMGGPKTKNLREFLAYHREALAPELPGTGKVSHATRVDLIDAALKNYAGMSEDQKKAEAGKKDELLKIRPDHVKKSGKTFPEPTVK
jgi:hypothetical protein